MNDFNKKLSLLFPFFALAVSAVAFFKPFLFTGLKPYIVPMLGMIMLSMGLTLEFKDFKGLVDKKGAVFAGVCLQFLVMPLAGYLLSVITGASPSILVGMILVGASAGGTASNVICFLAGGNVALSVVMTSVSTLCAVFLMPLLTHLYAGQVIDVPMIKMLQSLIQVILIPVAAGMIINALFKKPVEKLKSAVPLVSVLLISLIIAIVVALNHSKIMSSGLAIYLMVIAHNGTGFFLGYTICRLLGYDRQTCQTVSIEVGMQNSGLSVAMALKHFSAAAALPGAIFSIWHNVAGSILAAFWGSGNRK